MTTTKNTITNAVALAEVVNILKGNEPTINTASLLAKVEHMAAQAAKKRENKGPKTPTKEQREAMEMAKQLAEWAQGRDAFTTKDIMEAIPFVTSPQKATAIAKRAIAAGLIEKAPSVDSKVSYRAC